jgi:tetratricopeptide (TPR) repeat protein
MCARQNFRLCLAPAPNSRCRGARQNRTPDFPDARINLGHALSALGKSSEAIACYRAALQVEPNNAAVHFNLAAALRDVNLHEEAVEHCRRAITINPALTAAHAGLGGLLLDLGEIGEAKKCFEKAISLAPERPGHYLGLAKTTKLNSAHALFPTILGLAEKLEGASRTDAIDTRFVLAKVLADNGEHEKSFEHLFAGNALKRRTVSYDEAEVLRQIDRTRAVFSKEFIRERLRTSCPSALPIFIVGMPRSGSTLVEQVLASHPFVSAAGEVSTFCDSFRANGLHVKAQPFPDSVPDWPDERLYAAAREYVLRLRKERRRSAKPQMAERVTDKMLSNFDISVSFT